MKRRNPLARNAWKRKPADPAKAAASKRRQQKRAKQRHEDAFGPHADWVREKGCEVRNCFAPAEAHHQPFRSHGGKAKDLVGLCEHHHRTGRHAIHQTSLAAFDREHGTDLIAAAARNWAESPHGEQVSNGGE